MSLTAKWYDSSGYPQLQECDYVEEGEHGLILKESQNHNQIGYIPYEKLVHVVPTESIQDD